MSYLTPDSKIYVAGHKGLIGSALVRLLQNCGYQCVFGYSHDEVDLCDPRQTRDLFDRERPDIVFLCAAKVGGILANDTYPADFIYQNLMIESNVLSEAARTGVKRLIFLGSSCIYPRDCPQPVREEYLLTGLLEPTNRPYAIAKIAGIEMCSAYNRQHDTRFLAVMPTNLYGTNDHYHPENSHVIPALILKMHEAKKHGAESVTLWGTGKARREFLYSDDLARAMLMLSNLPEQAFDHLVNASNRNYPLINVGCGHDITIAELATTIADVVGFRGEICWDHSKPDGTPRKVLDTSRINALGWRPEITLKQGLRTVYEEKFEMATQA